MLDHFCSPLEEIDAVDAPPHLVQLRELLDLVEPFASEPWARGHSFDVLRRVLLIFNCNAHTCEHGTNALLVRGCIFNHACDPNAGFSYSGDEFSHVALRPIAAGEALSINYLGDDAAIGAPMRQALIQVKWAFLCACPRCSGPDLCRAIPCLRCHPRPLEAALPRGGIAYMVPHPSHDGAQPSFEWSCRTCEQTWSDRQVQTLTALTKGGRDWAGGKFLLSSACFRYVNGWDRSAPAGGRDEAARLREL